MSKYCANCGNCQRDSFGDRICIDLSEVILQYLNFEDKLRLECVSTLFQQTIFKKTTELEFFNLDVKRVRVNNLDKILHRFNKLKVKLNGMCNSKTIEHVMNKSYNLTELGLYGAMNEQTERNLVNKFGQKLTKIKFNIFSTDIHWQKIANIEDLSVMILVAGLCGTKFDNLKHMTVQYFGTKEEEDINLLEELAKRNALNITHLQLLSNCVKNEHNFKWFLNIVAKFKNLVHFSIGNSFFRINEKCFEEELELIANNCPLLKSLDICYPRDPHNDSTDSISLLSLMQFNSLRRLKLVIFSSNVVTIDSFRSLQNLTNLSLNFEQRKNDFIEYDNILVYIVTNLPNLRHLEINGKQEIRTTERTADLLSKLLKLESIVIKISDPDIQKQIEIKIIEKCKYIRNIKIINDH